jgi:chromosome segregation ATPase
MSKSDISDTTPLPELALKVIIARLELENAKLKEKNAELEQENPQLKEIASLLKEKHTILNEGLENENDDLKRQIDLLNKKIEELEKRAKNLHKASVKNYEDRRMAEQKAVELTEEIKTLKTNNDMIKNVISRKSDELAHAQTCADMRANTIAKLKEENVNLGRQIDLLNDKIKSDRTGAERIKLGIDEQFAIIQRLSDQAREREAILRERKSPKPTADAPSQNSQQTAQPLTDGQKKELARIEKQSWDNLNNFD